MAELFSCLNVFFCAGVLVFVGGLVWLLCIIGKHPMPAPPKR